MLSESGAVFSTGFLKRNICRAGNHRACKGDEDQGKQGSDKERNPECGCNCGCNPLSTLKCTGVLLFAAASGEKLYVGAFGVQKAEGNVLWN